MKEEVNLSIKSRQHIVGGSVDKFDYQARGCIYKKRGSYYIVYKDYSEGLNGARTNIKIDPGENRVVLIRSEPAGMKQYFQEGRSEQGYYQTGKGELEIETETKCLDIDIEGQSGRIFINYNLYINKRRITENNITVLFKKREE